MIDTHTRVETPEGIELHLVPAGPVARILAYLIDWCIRVAVLIVISMVTNFLDNLGTGLFLILYFVLEWFYAIAFEMFANGMTPGKRVMGLQVVHDDGTPLGWYASVMRNLLRGADALPFGYAAGLITMISSNAFKRLGDHVAGTLVIYVEPVKNKVEPVTKGARPMPCLMMLEEQQAILSFAERSEKLSNARQQELADLLEDILPVEREDRVKELRQIANGITGRS